MLALATIPSSSNSEHHTLAPLDLRSCGGAHLFIDGGSNLGESVDAFYGGAMHRCALHSPNRLYGKSWQTATGAERAERVSVLASPKNWCVRSFEANPKLLPLLNAREQTQRAEKLNVRYIDGLLGTTTSRNFPRKVVTYSHEPSGSSATVFDWAEIHFAGMPPNLADETVVGPAFDVREVISESLRQYPRAQIALKLDVEGGEFSILDALLEPPDGPSSQVGPRLPLLCNVSFLFVEYHNLHANLSRCACTECNRAQSTTAPRPSLSLRDAARLTFFLTSCASTDGLPYNASSREPHMLAYFLAGARVKEVMDTPGCKLQIHWRNFWNACGEPARYAWMGSEQVTGNRKSKAATANVTRSTSHAKLSRRRGLRERV